MRRFRFSTCQRAIIALAFGAGWAALPCTSNAVAQEFNDDPIHGESTRDARAWDDLEFEIQVREDQRRESRDRDRGNRPMEERDQRSRQPSYGRARSTALPRGRSRRTRTTPDRSGTTSRSTWPTSRTAGSTLAIWLTFAPGRKAVERPIGERTTNSTTSPSRPTRAESSCTS